MELLQLGDFVDYGPEDDASHSGGSVGAELCGALLGGAHEKALAQLVGGASERGGQDVLEDVVRLGVVFRDVQEHRGDGVWEVVGVLAGGAQVFLESRFCVGECFWGCVCLLYTSDAADE